MEILLAWSVAACYPREPADPPHALADGDSPALGRCRGWDSNDPCRSRRQTFVREQVVAVRGDDDRLDLHCLAPANSTVADADGISAATSPVAALFLAGDLVLGEDGRYYPTPKYDTLEHEGKPLCPDEVFAGQPRGAWCGAVLVGARTVLTAEHCIPDDFAGLTIAFGFVMPADGGAIAIGSAQVCRPAPHEPTLHTNDKLALFDIVCEAGFRRPPAIVAPTAEPPTAGMAYAIGFPSQLTAKFSGWSAVRGHDPPLLHLQCDQDITFHADFDITPGNSGSPVFDAQHRVIGVIESDGARDFCRDPIRHCYHWASVPTGSHQHVTITSTHEIPAALSARATGTPGART